MLDDTTQNLPAMRLRLSDVVAEYDAKAENAATLVAAFADAKRAAENGAGIGGTYGGDIWGRMSPSLDESNIKAALLKSAWRHVYAGLNLETIAPASDRERFERAFEDPAPFTLANIRETFGKYLIDPRGQILRGLAEVFGDLDPAFKSHDKMKIGVKGLPKRVILSSVDNYGSGWGSKRVRDIINAVRSLTGQPLLEWAEFSRFLKAAAKDDPMMDGITLRRFGNGNGHLFFTPETLRAVNLALAEYYGDVLPDCPEERPARAASREVSKDLQFYRTPAAAAARLVERAGLRNGLRILEPSCGDGAILDAIRAYADRNHIRDLRAMGVEVDPGRAAETRAKGYAVQCANFLQLAPARDFDVVLMNPPFYGKHYQKHVEHARRFLKPGGRLLAILPVTAATDHGFVKVPKYGRDVWEDLPVGSFSESGTNINTGIALFGALGGAE